MDSASNHNQRTRRLTCLGAPVVLLGLLACGGNDGPPPISATPPTAPTILVPATGTTGFRITASIQGASSVLTYTWTLTPGTFSGGAATATGTAVAFTPAATGTVTLTCTALAGNAIPSTPSQAQVTISPPSTAAGSFQPAGSLLTGRLGLAAATLPGGSILVMGGSTTPGGAGLASTEIYSPTAQSSAAGPAMNTARAGHAVAQLPGGTQLLVTGGTGAGGTPASPASEIYDSGLNVFSPTAAMASGRTGHTATFLISPAGVLAAGGVTAAGTPVNTEELFNPASQTFSSAGTVPLAPGHTATTLPNGKVLLVSHSYQGTSWLPFATVYDPVAGTFSPTANLPGFPREGHQALLLTSPAKVLIVGGDGGSGPMASAEWYDPATGLFSPVGSPMASPRRDFGAAILPSGRVLLLGGSPDGSTTTATAEVFDPVAVTFTPTGNLGMARRGPVTFRLSSGKILVLGGSNGGQGVAAVETY